MKLPISLQAIVSKQAHRGNLKAIMWLKNQDRIIGTL